MAVKPYNIEPDEKPKIAAEPALAYGNTSYSDMVATLYSNDSVLEQDNAAVLKRKAEFDEDEDLDDESYNAAEWDEIERESVMLGIEQMLRGECRPMEETFRRIYKKLDAYKETRQWS